MAVARHRFAGWIGFLATTSATAFVLNWSWEMSQMRAYRDLESKPWQYTLVTCMVAAVGDVVLTLLAYGVCAALARNFRWGWSHRPLTYVVLAIVGLVVAVIVERVAFASGNWSYNDRMPVIPGIGVGLWPVLQLTLLIPLSFWVGNVWRRRNQIGGA